MLKCFLFVLCVSVSCMVMAQGEATQTTHEVVKGETLYAIAKMYHVSVEAIEKANKVGEDFKIRIGQKILIPASASPATTKTSQAHTDAPAKAANLQPAPVKKQVEKAAAPEAASTGDPTTHIVVKGDNVYALSRTYGLTVKQIKDANHLPDDMKLKLGQKLIMPSKNAEAMYKAAPKEPKAADHPAEKPEPAVKSPESGKEYTNAELPAPVIKREPARQEPATPVQPVIKESETQPVIAEKPVPAAEKPKPSTPAGTSEIIKNQSVEPNDYAAVFSKYSDSGKKKMLYRGIGSFMAMDHPGNQYLALYNYAEIGSILQVTNLMSKQTIYVKVVGKVPGSDAQNEIILKVSLEAANQLRVDEDKFLVEVAGYTN